MTDEELQEGREENLQLQGTGSAEPTLHPMNPWEDSMTQLKQLASLGNNWDGYGAEAPNGIALTQAGLGLAYNERLGLPLARITPSTEGGVALCYFTNDGYALIEFYNDGEVAAMTKKGEDENYWDVMDNEIEGALVRIRGFLDG